MPRSGWAPLWRRLFDSRIWRELSPPGKVVLVWVIGSIRHTDGAVEATREDIARACGVSVRAVSTALASLHERRWATVQRRPHAVRIEVVGWRRWMVAPGSPPVDSLWGTCGDEGPDEASPDASSAPGADHELDPGDLHVVQDRSARGAALSISEEEEKKIPDLDLPGDQVPPGISVGVSTSPVGEEQAGDAPSAVTCPPRAGNRERAVSPRAGQKRSPEGPPDSPNLSHRIPLDLWHGRWTERYGHKPDLGKAAAVAFFNLCKKHGAEEVARRVAIAFDAPPRWMSPPITWQVFVSKFDVFVQPAGQQGQRLTGNDIRSLTAQRRAGRGGDDGR